jgi:hypothetical protein
MRQLILAVAVVAVVEDLTTVVQGAVQGEDAAVNILSRLAELGAQLELQAQMVVNLFVVAAVHHQSPAVLVGEEYFQVVEVRAVAVKVHLALEEALAVEEALALVA